MILLGVQHTDFEGPKRLNYALKKLSPRSVTIEYSVRENLARLNSNFKDYSSTLTQQLAKANFPTTTNSFVCEYIENKAYELRTVLDFCSKHNVPLNPVDHPVFTVNHLKNLSNDEAKVKLENIVQALFGDFSFEALQQISNTPYGRIRGNVVKSQDNLYHSSGNISIDDFGYFNCISDEGISDDLLTMFINDKKHQEERESFMATEILKHSPDVHIAGIAHCFPGYYIEGNGVSPLYKRLGNKIKKAVKLCNVFKEL